MKERDVIDRLRDLRRHREERAREDAIRSHTAAQRAARQGREAAAAVTDHLERTVNAENATFGALVGQTVKVASLRRVQGRFEGDARKTEQLREKAKAAALAEQRQQAELSAARHDYQASMRAVAKLDRLSEQLTRRCARRRQAFAELSEEEERGQPRLSTER